MSQVKNNVEVIQPSVDNNDYRVLPAVATEEWEQDAFLYYLSGNLKKFVPADTTATEADQAKIIGIAQAGKKVGDIEAIVSLKTTVLMDSTAVAAGREMVVKYNATTGRYAAQGGASYNTDFEPDITLTLNFLVAANDALEADGRGKLLINGLARFNALN